MAESDTTTKRPADQSQWEWLGSLVDRAFWPIEGLIKTLKDDEGYSDLFAALVPLVDCAKADLEILEKVCAQSFGGPIKIETAHPLRIFGAFERENFGKAFVEPEKVKKPGAGGE